MKRQILWFRRDLRVNDNKILSFASGEVLPIFIFDKNILGSLDKDDKRVSLIYLSVIKLKQDLQQLGLDLAIFYDNPVNIFKDLQQYNFDEVLCSVDFAPYSIKRDNEINQIIKLRKFNDAFLLHPENTLSPSGKPYKVFTPFYKNLKDFYEQKKLETYKAKKDLIKFNYNYQDFIFSKLGFIEQDLSYIELNTIKILARFIKKITNYQEDRDYFNLDATSGLSIHLRFGLISVRELFNAIRDIKGSDSFIRQMIWREFYNSLLYFFPQTVNRNANNKNIHWQHNQNYLLKWQQGDTGIAIIDAAMRHLNHSGLMHNRLRMIVASFLSKNLLIDWRYGERYFAKKLLDYELSSNVYSWQYIAGTGFDSPPAFRVFNPLAQSLKYDKNAIFIKKIMPQFNNIAIKEINNPDKAMLDIKTSRARAIKAFS